MSLGLPLHVTEIGPFSGRGGGRGTGHDGGSGVETFVLLHGYGGNSFTWRHWVEALAARGRVVLVDMKGFGDAPKPDDGRYDPFELAGLIVELVQRLDPQYLTLIGHSLGGGVALLTTLSLLDKGERGVQRLAVVAGAAYRQRLPPFVALTRRPRLSATLIRLLGPRFVIRRVLRSIVHDPDTVSDEQVAAYSRPLESSEGVRALLDAGRQIVPVGIEELSRRLPEIDIPVLLLWGRHDRVVPLTIGRRLEADLPDARLEILEECGHLPPEEVPVRSLAILESFLDAHPPT
jgi:pimeloyl-ACP methyl ester carboxylesterase